MRYKVPHNIDMQDRIVGPLTMIQFIEAVIGGGLAFITYSSVPTILGKFLGILIGIFTVAFVFLKINERPFPLFLFSLIQYMLNPKQRKWKKDPNDSMQVEIIRTTKEDKPTVQSKNIAKEDIEDLAKNIDSEAYHNIKT